MQIQFSADLTAGLEETKMMGEHASYHQNITGLEAQQRLTMCGRLSYLTRFSEQWKCYILSVYKPGPVIKHFKIVIEDDGQHRIDGKRMTFPDIGALLSHYERTRPDPAFTTTGQYYTEQDYSQAVENRRAEEQRRAEERRQARKRREAEERKRMETERRAEELRQEERERQAEQLRQAQELIVLRQAEDIRQTDQLRQAEEVEALRQAELNGPAEELLLEQERIAEANEQPDIHQDVEQPPEPRQGEQLPAGPLPGEQPQQQGGHGGNRRRKRWPCTIL